MCKYFHFILFAIIAVTGCGRSELDESATFCWADVSDKRPRYAGKPASLIANDKSVMIAWEEQQSIKIINYVKPVRKKFDGPRIGISGSFDPLIRFDHDRNPVLVWREWSDDSRQHVARYEDGKWILFGKGLNLFPGRPDESSPDLVFDHAGAPIASWIEKNSEGVDELLVARWDGKNWVQLPGLNAKASSLNFEAPYLHIDNQNRLWIAWGNDKDNQNIINLTQWDGNRWLHYIDREGNKDSVHSYHGIKVSSTADGSMALGWTISKLDGRQSRVKFRNWKNNTFYDVNAPEEYIRDAQLTALVTSEDGITLAALEQRDGTGFTIGNILRQTSKGWIPILTKMHLDSGQSDIYGLKLVAAHDNLFYMSWLEKDEYEMRIRLVQMYPCKIGEKQKQPPELKPLQSFWPKSVDEAARKIVNTIDTKSRKVVIATRKEDLSRFHHGWGTGIRNSYGLWNGNTALLESCGGTKTHPDDCSMKIITRVWEMLREEGK